MAARNCIVTILVFFCGASLAHPVLGQAHVLAVSDTIAEPEDGLIIGNGDISASIYGSASNLRIRIGKGDVWDRRLDRSEDVVPADIREVAHGIEVEGWQCPPYGDREPVALHGAHDVNRMRALCTGVPPSYGRRPYPCPKPVGELSLQFLPDLPNATIRHELTIEEGVLRTTIMGSNGVTVRLTCFVAPKDNLLVVEWSLEGWEGAHLIGRGPPLRVALYRWPDPPIAQFARDYFTQSGCRAFFAFDGEKSSPLPPPEVVKLNDLFGIQQSFPSESTYPAGFKYHLVPYASFGGFHTSQSGRTGEARLACDVPVEATGGLIYIALQSSGDENGTVSRVVALGASERMEMAARCKEENRVSAAEFWQVSTVKVADPLLENLWYETLHVRRATTRAGKTPPGLFLPCTVRDYSLWHGDYHTNYNFQQSYWGDLTANHPEIGDAYTTGMGYLQQMGRLIAERYYHCRGTFIQLSGYPIKSTDDCLGAVPMGRMAYMTGWAATYYWERYLKTLDIDWLRSTGYPFLRDCALFYHDFMEKRSDGFYHIFPSNQGEDGFSANPSEFLDRGQVMRHARYCLRAAIRASEVLECDVELRAAWTERFSRAAGDDGKPPVRLEGADRLFQESGPPEFAIGRPYQYPKSERAPLIWPPIQSETYRWYAGKLPWEAIRAIRSQQVDGETVYRGLRTMLERWRHPNGLVWAMNISSYGHAGAWTETLGIGAPLQEMMLQSFGGVLRIFPCWPSSIPAEFSGFRAEGAFLVSASHSAAGVDNFEIKSEKGGRCRFYFPWGTLPKVSSVNGFVAVDGPIHNIYSFKTEAGGSYTIRNK